MARHVPIVLAALALLAGCGGEAEPAPGGGGGGDEPATTQEQQGDYGY